jgi:uncharacterized repeat protein (TIGR02543 family)
MKLKYLLGVIFGLIISTAPFKTFQTANASNDIVVAIKQDNFFGSTSTLDTIFRRSGMAFYSSGGVYLTTNGEGQAGAFFSRNRIYMNNATTAGFSTYFQMYQGGGHDKYQGQPRFGDGFTFIISKNVNVLGGTGSSIGYGGITNSVAIMFDTFNNGGAQIPVCVSLGFNGGQGTCTHVGGYFNLDVHAWVDYSRETGVMELRMSTGATRPANPITRYTGLSFDNVGDEFFAGFTASTGGAVQTTFLRRWYMTGFFNAAGIDLTKPLNYVQDPTGTLFPSIEPVYLEDRKLWSFRPDPARPLENITFYTYAYNGENNRSVYFDEEFPDIPTASNALTIDLYAVSEGGVLSARGTYPFHKAFFNLNYQGGGIQQRFYPEYREAYPVTENVDLWIPERLGYTFKGWGLSSTQTRNLVTNHTFLRNGSFFAQWTIAPFEVSFNSNGGTPIPSQTTDVVSGVTLPQTPEKDFAEFDGWFLDEDLTIPFNPSTPLGADVTLFAKWIPVEYTVSISCDQTGDETRLINHGDSLVLDDKEDTDDQIFLGWFTDEALTTPYVSGPITEDTTVYAKWLDISLANVFTRDIALLDLETLSLEQVEELQALNALFSSIESDVLFYISDENKAKLNALNAHMDDLILVNNLVQDIDALSRIAYLEDEEAIRDALAIYDQLTPAQLELLPYDREHQLLDLERQLNRLVNADEVTDLILALPEVAGLDDLDAVSDAYQAYLNLTDLERDLLDPEIKQTFLTLVGNQPALLAVRTFVDLVDALPSPLNLDHMEDVDEILDAWHAMTPEQQAYVPGDYQDKVLELATLMIHLREADVFEAVMDPVVVNITLENQEDYLYYLNLYDGLHEAQIDLLTDETKQKIEQIRLKIAELNRIVDPDEPVDPDNPGEPTNPNPVDPIPEEPKPDAFYFPWIIVFVILSIVGGGYVIKEKL